MHSTIHRRRAVAECLAVTALAFAGTLAVFLTTERISYTHALFPLPWDHHKYLRIASGRPGDFHIAPFCWRVGKPLLAKVLPLDYQTGFVLITVACVVATAVLVYYLARAHALPAPLALAGSILFLTLEWGPTFFLFDFWLPDSLVAPLLTAAILAIVTRRDALYVALLVAGVTVKESMLFVVPLYYSLNARAWLDRRLLARATVLALPAVATLVAIRMLIPAWNDDPDYVATLDIQLFSVQDGSPAYDYVAEFKAEGLPRFQRFDREILSSYTLNAFGPALVVLPLLATRRNLPLLLRYSPFLLLVATPMLFAQDTERFLVMAFPAVILMALNGLASLARVLRLRDAWMLVIPLAMLGLELWHDTGFFVPRRVQIETLLVALLALVIVAVLGALSTWIDGPLIARRAGAWFTRDPEPAPTAGSHPRSGSPDR
jgi:hypothetical protein